MKYVLSAQDYQFVNGSDSQKLRDLITAVPQTIWESLDSIMISFTESNQDSEKYQEVLLEAFEDIDQINESQHLVYLAGSANESFFNIEDYNRAVEEAFAVYEGLWDTVKDFLKAITEGGSAIGVLHLILDIIGLVPGSWVGFPIDIVANLLNALIYGARGMWFLAILSAIAAIPANYVFKGLKMSLTPFAKILDKLGIAIFKADTTAVKLASAELKAAAGVEKATTLAGGLQGLVGFLKSAFLQITKGIAALLGKVINIATFGTVKTEKVIKFVEQNIEVPMMKAVKGSEDAIAALKGGDELLAVSTKADVAAVATAKGLPVADIDMLVSKFNKIASGNGDLVAKATNSKVFKEMVEAGAPKAAQEAYINAAVARMAFDDAIKATDKILGNPQALNILKSAGWRGADDLLIKQAINASDDVAIAKIFKEMTENPAILKSLTEGEASIMRVYSKFPKDFIKHGKYFDDYLKTLKTLAGRYAYRERIGRRLLLFMMRQIAKAIMSNKCYDVWKKEISGVDSVDDLTGLAATQIIKEEAGKTRDQVKAQILKEYQIKEADLNEAGKAELNQLIDEAMKTAEASDADCGFGSDAVDVVTGTHMLNPGLYSEENRHGQKVLTDKDYDALIGTQKEMLKYLGLDADIDPLHDMTNADPMVKLYFSDVYDPNVNMMGLNTGEESKLKSNAEYLRKTGEITSDEELDKLINSIKRHWEEGTEPIEVQRTLPETPADSSNINESRKINNSNVFMSFDQFKNFNN
jgi:hypothetical protein